ncbi:GNAT family N-acetyltransferase [Deinococcus fonticola]|uniref:GNAT family N-acetyltransferase n=1 Tax=Deinococcus fonticola TaxID=2528713 RepID=UPI00107535FC|nr:GNAT family N-acetyltransferase [Deinococcus fonticola]
MLTFRPTRAADLPAVQELLQIVWKAEEGAVAYHGSGRRPGVVAEVNGRLVGYALTWQSALHPTHAYVGVHVHPLFREQGIGLALWQAVTRDISGSVKVKTYASQLAGVRFQRARGLALTVETHEPTLRPSDVAPNEVAKWAREAQALGFELLPMTALPDGVEELARLHEQVYLHSHEHDPAQAGVLDADDFLGDDLVPGWLYLARKGGVLAGVSSVRLDQPLPMLGWFGVTKEFASLGAPLTLALTGLAIQAAGRAGVTELAAELDSAEPGALHLLHALPWRPDRVWFTFTGHV